MAYTPAGTREAFGALLAFDAHLGRLVAGAKEPLVGQIRLAWWREELEKPAAARAVGSPELGALGKHWEGEEATLIQLVNGWERLLGPAPLPGEAIGEFAAARGACFAALERFGASPGRSEHSALAGRRWALADLAGKTSDPRERDLCQAMFAETPRPARLPRLLRGLAVLEGLATRAMERGEPLLEGRGGALAAMRLGLLGR